jgi:SAM-dependent methyltransferase
MKVLYESVISTDWRHRLGEYYTPDWLAERMVLDVVDNPLSQRVLDPACGSGTFLFHAVRRYLGAADLEQQSNSEAIAGATGHVLGVDVHPVAVTLARLTYLLAIGRDRLAAPGRPDFHVPVYLGDSVQWRTPQLNLWTQEGLTIAVDDGAQLWASNLHFPDRLLDDAGQFDRLVEELADKAANRKPGSPVPSLAATFTRFGVHPEDRPVLDQTFATMCQLHDENRDHVWSYYVRNLARPTWLAREPNRVDRIVGNPPWLAYRFMTAEMQASFRQLSEERGLWAGASVATHQDLSGLFLVRAVELYLKPGGKFSLVMPLAALTRRQFAALRTGSYAPPSGEVAIDVSTPWDLHKVKPRLFRVPPSVICGTRSTIPVPLSDQAEVWAGSVPSRNLRWSAAEPHLTRSEAGIGVAKDAPKSLYHSRFSQGATLVPRMLVLVEEAPVSPIGVAAGRVAIRSSRSPNEKPPWKNLPDLTGSVESEFVRPVHLGQTVLPYRTHHPLKAVVPLAQGELLDTDDARLDLYPGLADWWRAASEVWDAHKGSTKNTLTEQINFRKKLTLQLPAATHRIVYTGTGQYLAAARIEDTRAIFGHLLYWATANSVEESRYLTAILNSQTLGELVAPYQPRGEHNPRHFDKLVWRIPIPLFDPKAADHTRLVELAERAEQVASEEDISSQRTFQAQRRLIRQALTKVGISKEIDTVVRKLVDLQQLARWDVELTPQDLEHVRTSKVPSDE